MTVPNGFLYSGGTNGSYTTIDVPGSSSTSAEGINASGQIVGIYSDSSGEHAFLDSGGVFTTIAPPGGIGSQTYLGSINDSGQIVGWYQDSSG